MPDSVNNPRPPLYSAGEELQQAAERLETEGAVDRTPGILNKETGEFTPVGGTVIDRPLAKRDAADAPLATREAGGPIVAKRRISADVMAQYKMPSIHLFQAVGKESEIWGEHPKGSWINSLTMQPIDLKMRIVPIFMYDETLVVFKRGVQKPKGQSGVVERYTYRRDVPQQHLEDPRFDVVSYMNWLIVMEGQEYPFVIPHKSTHLDAAKSLNFLVDARKGRSKPRGAYIIGARERTNDLGKFFVPTYQNAAPADAPADLADMAAEFELMFFGKPIEAYEPEEPTGDNDATVAPNKPADDASAV